MDDEPHVGLVDTHAEGVGGHHYTHLARSPLLLPYRALLARQTSVIETRADALGRKLRAKLLDAVARPHIDYGRAGDARQHAHELTELVLGAPDHIRQVGTGETAAHDARLAERERIHYIGRDGLRRRCRERQHGHARQQPPDLGYAAVGGSEVVAPLRYAVRLVDGQQRDIHALQAQAERIRGQTLGCDIEKLHVAVGAVVQRYVDAARIHARMDGHGGYAARPQAVDLILHKGDERRDDYAQTLAGHRRQLVEQRLAAAGGHQCERVAPRQHRLDDLALHRAERLVAPPPLQHLLQASSPVLYGLFHRTKIRISREKKASSLAFFPRRSIFDEAKVRKVESRNKR